MSTKKIIPAKRGRMSKNEMDVIRRFSGKKSIQEIATQLRRTPEQVAPHIVADSPIVIDNEIESRPEWAQLRNQFDNHELEYFKYRYTQLMNQFGRDDVLATEEMQIFGLITVEVMANQTLTERKTWITQQKTLQTLIDNHATKGKAKGEDLKELNNQFSEISAQLKAINTRHESYRMQQGRLLESLKATRDQRVKDVAGGRISFLGHLKALQLEEFRKSTGDDMETMRIAMERAKDVMSQPHVYADGMTDQPLLTLETSRLMSTKLEPTQEEESTNVEVE